MADLAIIIVTWNVRDLLQRCLNAVVASLDAGGLRATILVVDNASSDGTAAMLRAEFPQVQVIAPGHNLGFAGGNNLALRTLFAVQPDADAARPAPYVLLLNPDTEPERDALPRLVAYLAAHPDIMVVGPQLRYADGAIQSSRRRFPTRLTYFWESTPLERLWPGNPWARRYHCADLSPAIEQRVDWLVGAALLVRRAAIERAGLLDEGFFMYSEELEWQWRIQRSAGAGGNPAVAYLPAAVVTHYEGKSSEQDVPQRHVRFQRSKLRLAQLQYGRLFATLLRLFLLLGYGWELGSEAAKLLLGHRRELRRRRIGVYATILRSGLR